MATRRSDGLPHFTAADELALERRIEPGSAGRSLALAAAILGLLALLPAALPCAVAATAMLP
jgi:hypothetical protein